jgi:hypothetical protein
MGLFSRKDRTETSGFWKYTTDVVVPGERRVAYAHLIGHDAQRDLRGTLFLTDRQVIWRITSPGPDRGDGFQVPLGEILSIHPSDGTGRFGIGVALRGGRGQVQFMPQRPRDPASKLIAEHLRTQIESLWLAAKAEQSGPSV